jgi:perosamine synthetase
MYHKEATKYLIKNIPKYIFFRTEKITYLSAQTLGRDDVKLTKKWLTNHSHWYNCEFVHSYEMEFAKWNNSKYAFAFGAGRVALSACIYALGLKPGDEVILPAYTCIVVPNAFRYEQIKPVFCDIELDTYGLDFKQIERKITSKTRAILIQHLYGLVSRDYEEILNYAKNNKIWIIEDCAHSTGAKYKNIKVGNRGDVSFFSSNRTKVFNTVEGGMAVTNNRKIGARLKDYYDSAPYPDESLINKLLHNVLIDYYTYKHPHREILKEWINIKFGYMFNYSTSTYEQIGERPPKYTIKLAAPLAVLGLNQLKKIDQYNERRRQTAKVWDSWCDKYNYKKPLVIKDSIPVFVRYPVLVESDKKLNTDWAIDDLRLELGVWFVSNLHPSNENIGVFPNADTAVKRCVNLPCIYHGFSK